MAGKKRVSDAQVEAANQIYEVAKREAEAEITRLKEDVQIAAAQGEDIGILKKIRLDDSFNELIRIIVLYRFHQNRAYKERGLTFEQICEIAGKSVRAVYEIFEDMRPLLDNFSALSAHLLGMKINKIRYLGRAVCADSAQIRGGKLYYDGEEIDDLEAFVDAMNEKQDSLRGDLKAAERHLQTKEKHIRKMEKVLAKYEGRAAERDLSPEEDAFLTEMENLRIAFDGYMLSVEPERIENLSPEPTTLMRAEYLTTLWRMKARIKAAYDTAVDSYGYDLVEGEDDWQPPRKK